MIQFNVQMMKIVVNFIVPNAFFKNLKNSADNAMKTKEIKLLRMLTNICLNFFKNKNLVAHIACIVNLKVYIRRH